MIPSWVKALAAVACFATAPAVLTAQQPDAQTAPARIAAPRNAGPRLVPEFKSYQPTLADREMTAASAVAADRTVITISTLGLVLIAILLIILLT